MNRRRIDRIPPKHRKAVNASIKAISRAIRAKRKARKLSQEELAEELGIAPTSLQAIEQGRRFPSLPMLFYIMGVLHIDFKLE